MIEYCSCGLPLHGYDHTEDGWQHVTITPTDNKEINGYKEPEGQPEFQVEEEE